MMGVSASSAWRAGTTAVQIAFQTASEGLVAISMDVLGTSQTVAPSGATRQKSTFSRLGSYLVFTLSSMGGLTGSRCGRALWPAVACHSSAYPGSYSLWAARCI